MSNENIKGPLLGGRVTGEIAKHAQEQGRKMAEEHLKRLNETKTKMVKLAKFWNEHHPDDQV